MTNDCLLEFGGFFCWVKWWTECLLAQLRLACKYHEFTLGLFEVWLRLRLQNRSERLRVGLTLQFLLELRLFILRALRTTLKSKNPFHYPEFIDNIITLTTCHPKFQKKTLPNNPNYFFPNLFSSPLPNPNNHMHTIPMSNSPYPVNNNSSLIFPRNKENNHFRN